MSRSSDAVELAAQIAELTKAGAPLAEGLRALADELPRGRSAKTLRELSAHLAAGASLESALEASASRLPAHLRGLLVAGIRSGDLGSVLGEYVAHQRMLDELRLRTRVASAYPLLLITVSVVWVLLMSAVVVHPLGKVLQDLDADISLQTQNVMWVGDHVLEITLVLVAFPLALMLLRVVLGAARMSRAWDSFPLLGALWRNRGLAEFTSLLGLLVRQQVPLPEALRLCATGVRHAAIASASRIAGGKVAAGESLAGALGTTPPFPPTLAPIVEWGERQATLPEALASASDWFYARTEMQSSLLQRVVPPLVFLVVFTTIYFVVTSIMVPITIMIQNWLNWMF